MMSGISGNEYKWIVNSLDESLIVMYLKGFRHHHPLPPVDILNNLKQIRQNIIHQHHLLCLLIISFDY